MVFTEVQMQPNDKKCDVDNHIITISNLRNSETLCYSLTLIKGNILSKKSECSWSQTNHIILRQYITNESTPVVSEWPVHNFEFKCLATLSVGNNHLSLEYCGAKTELVVIHQPRKTALYVLPVYIICQEHNGQFQAPTEEENSIESACERIGLGAKLIQCLTAEKLVEAGFERKTFQLHQDLNPSSPECVVFHSQLSVDSARKMLPYELWEYFGRELMMSTLASDNCKFLAFLSCTRYNLKSPDVMPKTHDDVMSMMEAHVALGGGGLAIFGTGCLHTWASDVEGIMPRFLNECKVDTQHFMDDSYYRGTYGGCYATTLGAVCHELGHTFDLGHSSEGIMGRGFDNVDLVFTLQSRNDNEKKLGDGNRNVISPVCKELPQHSVVHFTKVLNVSYTVSSPIKRQHNKSRSENDIVLNSNMDSNSTKITPSGLKTAVHEGSSNKIHINTMKTEFHSQLKNGIIKNANDCTYWSKSCAAFLNYHRWFNDEGLSQHNSDSLQFDAEKNALVSDAGIRAIEVRDETGLILSSWEFLDHPGKELFLLPLEAQIEAAREIVAMDSDGNILKHFISQAV